MKKVVAVLMLALSSTFAFASTHEGDPTTHVEMTAKSGSASKSGAPVWDSCMGDATCMTVTK